MKTKEVFNLGTNNKVIDEVKELLRLARMKTVRQVNRTMVLTYFEIGKRIVEEEQGGEERAVYGKQLLKDLSKALTAEFGRGFSKANIEKMRKFYLIYSNASTVSMQFEVKKPVIRKPFNLSWSHYQMLMRIDNHDERSFYEIEAESNNWSIRELKRQFDSALFERLSLSRDKQGVKELSTMGQILYKPEDAIKEPYVLEFLGLEANAKYSESDLENAIISKIEQFMLELGKGFLFVARQKRITFEERHFYVDLVFYNRMLSCFFLIDLKIGDLKHQDLGQMQMYVNYYDREMRLEGENDTIGLILSKEKCDTLVKYTLPEGNEQIFASKYHTILPSKEDLKKLIEG